MYMLLQPWEYCIRKGYYYVNHHLSYSYALYAPADYNTLLQSYSENHQTEVGSSLSLPYANVDQIFIPSTIYVSYVAIPSRPSLPPPSSSASESSFLSSYTSPCHTCQSPYRPRVHWPTPRPCHRHTQQQRQR